MSASFDVNWMTSPLIINAKLIMQFKVSLRKLQLFDKIYSNLFSYNLFLIAFIFQALNTCFSTISRKFIAVLLKIKFL